MYAIIRAGHRQFKVRAGTILRVTSLAPAQKKKSLQFPVVAVEEGKGIVLGSREGLRTSQVIATVLREGKTKKILVFKKKRRKGYRRTKGHRQDFIDVKISEIRFPSGKVEKAKVVVEKAVSTSPQKKAKALGKSDSKGKGVSKNRKPTLKSKAKKKG